jgi:hypothetical protein
VQGPALNFSTTKKKKKKKKGEKERVKKRKRKKDNLLAHSFSPWLGSSVDEAEYHGRRAWRSKVAHHGGQEAESTIGRG